jgi:hypothetical protein
MSRKLQERNSAGGVGAGQRGAAYIEFAFALLVLAPLLLGVIGLGLNMHRQMQTVQLARDAGHMYARYVDFTLVGNQQVLVNIAGTLGLSTTAGSGSALVILSTVRYVDSSACSQAGKVDSHGNPSGCTNYQQWVFSQRLVIGNNTLKDSNLGTPSSSIVAGNGNIAITDQVTNTTDVATMTGFNPWNSTSGTGVPSGQLVYAAEVAAAGFRMPPYAMGTNTYAQICF